MITVKISGGLGNQMFQYAAGQCLAKRLSTKLYSDLSWFQIVKNYPEATVREYELDLFGITPVQPNPIVKARLKLNPPQVFKEDNLSYQPAFHQLSGDVVLDGHWQSYKYFKGYEHEVHDLFSKLPMLSPKAMNLLDKIKNTNSVSLHIRRNDFVHNKIVNEIHGILTQSYYRNALKHISSFVSQPNIFIFSDDPKWCRDNFKLSYKFTIVQNHKNYEDMQLMSACKHNVIANSTFSWWAAWLNDNPDKIVIAPSHWRQDDAIKSADIIPKKWEII